MTSQGQSNRLAGKVFYYDEAHDIAHIAYPADLFEPGNLSQLLTVIAGNAFGLADVSALRLIDVSFPIDYVKSYPGPQFGEDGIYSLFSQNERQPLCGAIVKPKCGLSAEEHATVCYDAWIGMADGGDVDGVDFVKDDEAITHNPAAGSGFEQRLEATMNMLRRAEDRTGKRKIYVPNITSSNINESLRRAELVNKAGGVAVMVDFVIGGGALLHTLRLEGLGLVIHGHRTLFAALHRAERFGIDFMVWTKIFRMIGGDQMHSGTPALGVMEAKSQDVIEIVRNMREQIIQYAPRADGRLGQDFEGVKATLPVCGAGLDPLSVEPLVNVLGSSLLMIAGGDIHGHPYGTRAGAACMREAVAAAARKVPLSEWAVQRKAPWLDSGLSHFQAFDKQSPNAARGVM